MKYRLVILFFLTSIFLTSCTENDNNDIAPVTDDNITPQEPNVGLPKAISEVGMLAAFAPESSGIVVSDGFIWTHNDGNNPNEIYKVDTSESTLVQTVSITNFSNIDWEDITADDGYIYIGDFGNNDGIRKDLRVLKVDKAQFIDTNEANVEATAEAIEFSYSEQTSFLSSSTHNFDCESMISIGDSLYLFTKDRGDLHTRVYALPKAPGSYSITSLADYDVKGLVTGADYNSKTNEIALIGYTSQHKNSFLYFLSNFKGYAFFSGKVEKFTIGNKTNDWQTEGIAFSAEGNKEIYLSCETTSFTKSTLYLAQKDSLSIDNP